MTVEPLSAALARGVVPDEPLQASPQPDSFASALGRAFDATGASLAAADRSERAFAAGRGGLQEMILDRAQADVALSLAAATASRVSQALSTVLGMQI